MPVLAATGRSRVVSGRLASFERASFNRSAATWEHAFDSEIFGIVVFSFWLLLAPQIQIESKSRAVWMELSGTQSTLFFRAVTISEIRRIAIPKLLQSSDGASAGSGSVGGVSEGSRSSIVALDGAGAAEKFSRQSIHRVSGNKQ